jgi:hypothetical protein
MNESQKETENLEEFSEDDIICGTNDLLSDSIILDENNQILEEDEKS